MRIRIHKKHKKEYKNKKNKVTQFKFITVSSVTHCNNVARGKIRKHVEKAIVKIVSLTLQC